MVSIRLEFSSKGEIPIYPNYAYSTHDLLHQAYKRKLARYLGEFISKTEAPIDFVKHTQSFEYYSNV